MAAADLAGATFTSDLAGATFTSDLAGATFTSDLAEAEAVVALDGETKTTSFLGVHRRLLTRPGHPPPIFHLQSLPYC